MADSLEDHDGTVSIVDRSITNLLSADDIDGLAGQGQELVKLVNHLEEASTAYGMQISAEKTQLKTLCSVEYLGATVSDGGSKPKVLSRIAQTTAAVTKVKVI